MRGDLEMIEDAGLRTFEYAAPLLLVAAVVTMWHTYGWFVGVICAAGYVVAATLAWRAAWIAYRRRVKQ